MTFQQKQVVIKGILIAGTFDLPARYLVSGSVQLNGKYGCAKYFQSGESFKTASGGNVWIYLFNTKMILADPLEIIQALRLML